MNKKFVSCPHCQTPVRIKSAAPDRVELEKEMGERFWIRCPKCTQRSQRHVNDVVAKPNKLPAYVIWAICLVIWTVVLMGAWLNIFVLLTVTGTLGLPFAADRAVVKLTASFNDYKIRETKNE